MNYKPKTILVTGIGGNVGQGVMRIIHTLPYPIQIIGTNISKVSGGNHLCDRVYETPYGYEQRYLDVMKKICKKESVDLIMPCTDFESYELTVHAHELPLIASSSGKVNEIFLDKYLTWQHFSKYNIPFAESKLPSEYRNEFTDIIVKPRKGRGSKNIFMNPSDIHGFNDSYVIQKHYHGKEITSAFYITKKGKLVGHISMERELFAGSTKECSVTFDYDKQLGQIIKKIIKHIPIRGSCNIQSIALPDGHVIPFELNSRISGTNSVRHYFGFQDVVYTVEEYLYGILPKKPKIIQGTALRYLADVIFPKCKLQDVKDKRTKHIVFA
jgi:carbamoyl-phosphate synthase large subunit